jgi:sensitive to high expression protein 9
VLKGTVVNLTMVVKSIKKIMELIYFSTKSQLSTIGIKSKKLFLSPSFPSNLMSSLDKLTGYCDVISLKARVTQAERKYDDLRKLYKQVKMEYEDRSLERSNCQKDLNMMLQRKHYWNTDDVTNFTSLFQKEHSLERIVENLKVKTKDLEEKTDVAHEEMLTTIRDRYQEEQLWSDRVKSVSTYGTISLVILNIIMFMIVHGYIEPHRRLSLQSLLDNRLNELKNSSNESKRVSSTDQLLIDEIRALDNKIVGQIIELTEKNNVNTNPPVDIYSQSLLHAAGGVVGGYLLCALLNYFRRG